MSKQKPPAPKRYDDFISSRVIRAIEQMPRGLLALVKTWQGWIILLVLASQLALPIHYYTVRRDPHDERFAWRMFSPMRMTRCVPKFDVDGTPVQLATEFHEAWISIAKRGRFVVIEEMAARLCEKNPGKPVHVVLECTYVGDQPQTTWGGYDMCKVPEL